MKPIRISLPHILLDTMVEIHLFLFYLFLFLKCYFLLLLYLCDNKNHFKLKSVLLSTPLFCHQPWTVEQKDLDGDTVRYDLTSCYCSIFITNQVDSKCEVVYSSLRWIPPLAGWPGRYINLRCCRGLSMVLLQLKDALELFVKRREFLPSSGFLSHKDMTKAVKSDVKTHPIIPSNQVQSAHTYW